MLRVILAGLCVAAGSAMAGGCTSGYAVSGIARLSARAFVTTLVFLCVGVIMASTFNTARAMNVILAVTQPLNSPRTITFRGFMERITSNSDLCVPWINENFIWITLLAWLSIKVVIVVFLLC